MGVCETEVAPSDKLNDIEIDFEEKDKIELLNIIKHVESRSIPTVDDGYVISVNLKDKSTYAYAPRQFAYTERKQLQDTDR